MTTTKRPSPTNALPSDPAAAVAATTTSADAEGRRRATPRPSLSRWVVVIIAAVLSVIVSRGDEYRRPQNAPGIEGDVVKEDESSAAVGEPSMRVRPEGHSQGRDILPIAAADRSELRRGGVGAESDFYPRRARLDKWRTNHRPAAGVRDRDARLRKRAVGGNVGDNDEPMTPSLIKLDDSTPPPEVAPGCEAPLVIRPTCNSLHELDFRGGMLFDLLRKVSKGSVRNVWSALEAHDRGGLSAAKREARWENKRVSFVLKTLRWTRDFIPPIYEKQRREAAALEYLASSNATTDIYGFCGASALNGYAAYGNLADYVRRTVREQEGSSTSLSPAETLTIAARLAEAVADVQDEGRKTTGREGDRGKGEVALQVVHRDIGASNVLVADIMPLRVLLDDFNQAYLLRRRAGEVVCTYRDFFVCGEDGRRPDTRSPEECEGKTHLSQSIDTYGIGTVLFYLLTMQRAYSFDAGAPGPPEEFPDWYRDRVKGGMMPVLPPFVETNRNEAIASIKSAMKRALTADPEQRPSARSISNFLRESLRQYRKASLKIH